MTSKIKMDVPDEPMETGQNPPTRERGSPEGAEAPAVASTSGASKPAQPAEGEAAAMVDDEDLDRDLQLYIEMKDKLEAMLQQGKGGGASMLQRRLAARNEMPSFRGQRSSLDRYMRMSEAYCNDPPGAPVFLEELQGQIKRPHSPDN